MRNVIATVAAVVVLVVLAGAAFIYSGAYYVGADHPHWSITTRLLNQARDRSIRAYGRQLLSFKSLSRCRPRTIPSSSRPAGRKAGIIMMLRGRSRHRHHNPLRKITNTPPGPITNTPPGIVIDAYDNRRRRICVLFWF
jgi:hypothetical protein